MIIVHFTEPELVKLGFKFTSDNASVTSAMTWPFT